MQKESWQHTLIAVVFSAVCLMLRWLQNMIVYDAQTQLPASGSALSWLLAILYAVSAAVLFLAARRFRRVYMPTEPEEALAEAPKLLLGLLGAAGLGAAFGCVLLYFTGGGTAMRITALLGLLAVPALLLFPLLPRWGGLGAALSLAPVLFFSVWLVVAYRDNAVNPVVWDYGPLILAVASALFAAYQLAGYLFYRVQPVRAVFAASLAPVCGLTILMDETAGAARVILASWAVGLLAIRWLLIKNMYAPRDEGGEEEYLP